MSDKEIKVIFLGESGVGKTCLIQKLISDDYKENNSTISATYYTKTIKYEGKDYKFNIWDTAGNEKFRNLTKLFLKDVQIFVLVYDITKKKTFLELQYWLDYILEQYGPNNFIILIGNKSDLNNKEIKESKGAQFAEIIKAKFAQVSAKDSVDFQQNFEYILMDYLRATKKPKQIDYYDDLDFLDDLLY